MADVNSLTYLVYSLLALAAQDTPITDPAPKAWEINSELPVTEFNQEPDHFTEIYNSYKGNTCPTGEKFDECSSHCQRTCENVGKDVVCPQVCVPGCVCAEAGAVRGPNNKCIQPSLCPSAEAWEINSELPVTEFNQEPDHFTEIFHTDEIDQAEQDPRNPVDPDEIDQAERDPRNTGELNGGGCPRTIDCSRNCKRQGYKWGMCTGPGNLNCHCYSHMTVNPDEVDQAEEDPRNPVDPDEIDQAEQDSRNPSELDSDNCSLTIGCSKSCKRRGYKGGRCTGFLNLECECYSSTTVDPVQIDQAEQNPGELNGGGCPRTIDCSRNCKRQGYKWGMCTGPGNLNCQCYSHMTEEKYQAEQQPPLRVDPHEVDKEEQQPQIRGKLNSGGCPDAKACIRHCELIGRRWGNCVGGRRRICECSKDI